MGVDLLRAKLVENGLNTGVTLGLLAWFKLFLP